MANKAIYENEFTGKPYEDSEYGYLWIDSPANDDRAISIVDGNHPYQNNPKIDFPVPVVLKENHYYKIKLVIEECEQPEKESQP